MFTSNAILQSSAVTRVSWYTCSMNINDATRVRFPPQGGGGGGGNLFMVHAIHSACTCTKLHMIPEAWLWLLYEWYPTNTRLCITKFRITYGNNSPSSEGNPWWVKRANRNTVYGKGSAPECTHATFAGRMHSQCNCWLATTLSDMPFSLARTHPRTHQYTLTATCSTNKMLIGPLWCSKNNSIVPSLIFTMNFSKTDSSSPICIT